MLSLQFFNKEQQVSDTGLLKLFAIIRIIFAYCNLHTITFGHMLFAPLYYPHSFWTPISMSFLLGGPPEIAFIQWVGIVAIGTTVLLGLGLWTRYVGPLCFVASCLFMCISFSYGRLNHNSNTVPLLLLIFSFSDWGHFYSLDAMIRKIKKAPSELLKTVNPEWPIAVSVAAFSLPYFTTGLFKLLRGNFIQPGYISALVKYKEVFWQQHGTVPLLYQQIHRFMIDQRWFSDFLALMTLFVETFFCIALLSREARVFMLAMVLMMHACITLTTKIYFLEHMFMLAILLVASTILLFRDRYGWMEKLFPKTQLTADEIAPEENHVVSPHWKKTLWAMLASTVVVFGMRFMKLPEIAMQAWNKLALLHKDNVWFPTDSYLFFYDNDLKLGWASAILCLVILGYFTLRLFAKLWDASCDNLPSKAAERVLIYDGDCGFCQQWVNWSIVRGAEPRVKFRSWQLSEPLLLKAGLTPEQCQHASYCLELDDAGKLITLHQGAGAINHVLRCLPGMGNVLYRILGVFYDVDVIKQAQNIGYNWIANNRHKLAPGACKPDAKPQTT